MNKACDWNYDGDGSCEEIDLTVACSTITNETLCGEQYGWRCIYDGTDCVELTACEDYVEASDCDYI